MYLLLFNSFPCHIKKMDCCQIYFVNFINASYKPYTFTIVVRLEEFHNIHTDLYLGKNICLDYVVSSPKLSPRCKAQLNLLFDHLGKASTQLVAIFEPEYDYDIELDGHNNFMIRKFK